MKARMPVRAMSVQPTWMATLPLQQQSVLFLAARGPDGIGKTHPCKAIVRAYRGTVLIAAKYGRCLHFGEDADSFMSLGDFATYRWAHQVDDFFNSHDSLPHHYLLHLYHGAQILGYHHPSEDFRERWLGFYERACHDLHMGVESCEAMDERLNDWGREGWWK